MTALRARPGWALAVFVPALVLACDPGGFFPFGPAKWVVLTAVLPAAAAWLFLRRPVRIAPKPTLAAVALVVAMAIAAAVGEDPLYAWIGTPERHLGVLTWGLVAVAFVVGQSTTHDDHRLVLGGVVVAALGLGAMSILEALEWSLHTLDAGSRLGGTFGSPAYLGAAVALLLPATLGVVADRSWSTRWRSTAGAASVMLAVASIGAGSRAGWFGLAVALVATAVARRDRRDRVPDRRVLVLGAAVVIAAIGVVVVATPAGDRLSSTFDDDAAGGGPGRFDEWRVASRTLLEHPITGVGPEGYRIAFADGVDAAYDAEHGRDPQPDRAHSAPLDIALAGGPLGLAAWLALLGLLIGPVRRALRGDQPWLAGLGAGLAGYLGGQLLLFPLAELEPIAAVLAGIVVAATATTGSPLRERVAPRAVPIVLGVITVGALVAGGFDLDADRQADQASEAANAGRTDDAVRHAERAIDLRPDVLRNYLLLAGARIADQQGAAAAIDALDDGLDLSPGDPIVLRRRAELLVERAASTLVPAHVDEARAEVERILDDDPFNSRLWILEGVIAHLDGDDAAAQDAWERAHAIDPGNPVPVVALAQLQAQLIVEAVAAVVAAEPAPTGDGTG